MDTAADGRLKKKLQHHPGRVLEVTIFKRRHYVKEKKLTEIE